MWTYVGKNQETLILQGTDAFSELDTELSLVL